MHDKIKQWFKFFEYIGNIYAARYMYPVWNAYPKYYEDIWDSLCIFLEGYAFERQGASPNYHHAAIDSLLKYKKINEQLKSNEAPKKIWENFCKILNNDKLNELRNPLLFSNSEKSPYSVITIAKTFEEQTFSEYFATQIKNDKIKDAHNKLKEIRGVNDKIASFYLMFNLFIFIWYFRNRVNFNHPFGIQQASDKYNRYCRKTLFVAPFLLNGMETVHWILALQNVNIKFYNVL